jgi:peptide/nickel transport system substrate-binding protein
MSKRPLALLAAAAAFTLGVAACGSTSTVATSQPVHGGNMTIGIDNFPADLNPYSPTIDLVSLQVLDSWFEFLIEPSTDGTKYVPTLASSYTVSSDDTVYTFKLRSGVQFSNGTPMTAADVMYSLHQAFEQSGSQINFLSSKIQSITSPDAGTVVVTLKSAWPYLLSDLSGFNAPILPAALAQAQGLDAFLKHPVGTGPFALDSIVAGDSVKVVKNQHYWNPGEPYLDSITFKVINADVGRTTALKGGQADIVSDPALNQLAGMKNDSSVRVLSFSASQVDSILLNVHQKPLDNVNVRRAIALAIDRSSIVKVALFGTGKAANTFIVPPPLLTYQDPSFNGFPYDPTQAKQLISQSGVTLPIKLQAEFPPGALQDAVSTVMQQNLQAIGINLDIVRSDPVTVHDHFVAGSFTISTDTWGDFIGDPSSQVLFYEDPNYCCNDYFTNYSDSAAATLANQAVAEIDPAKAKAMFLQVQQLESQSSHVIPLFYADFVFLTTSKVTGFKSDPFGTYSYATIAFTK